MHHINIKIIGGTPGDIRVADAIPVFHRWIQERKLPELLIDVADYSHVPAGPGVLLIGHEANYSLDLTRNRLGLLYSRKAIAEGSSREQLAEALDHAGQACRMLESEPEFLGKLHFSGDELELTLNDRLLYPNTVETFEALEPELRSFFHDHFAGAPFLMTRAEDPRERFRVNVGRTVANR